MAFGGIRKGNKVSAEAAGFGRLGNLGQTEIGFLPFLTFSLFSSQPLGNWVRIENVPIRGVWAYPNLGWEQMFR